MLTEFGIYFLMLILKSWIRYMIFSAHGHTSLSILVSFSIGLQPRVIIINTLMFQHIFRICVHSILTRSADKMLYY